MKGTIKVSGKVYLQAVASGMKEEGERGGAAGIGGGVYYLGGGDMKGDIIFLKSLLCFDSIPPSPSIE